MNLKYKTSPILIIAILLIINNIYAQNDPKAKKILDEMSKAYHKIGTFTCSINQRIINEAESIDENIIGKLTVKNSMFRIKLDEQEIYNNGKTTWTYLKDSNEVNVENVEEEMEEMNPVKLFDLYKKDYHYAINGTKIINDKKHIIVDLGPKDKDSASFYKIRLTINEKTKKLKNFILFEKSGTKYKYQIFDYKQNIKIDDDYFTFNPKNYKDVEIIDLR